MAAAAQTRVRLMPTSSGLQAGHHHRSDQRIKQHRHPDRSATSGYNTFYRYQKPGVSTEYYLFENRQKTGRDSGLPAAGIAIWHVDELGDRTTRA